MTNEIENIVRQKNAVKKIQSFINDSQNPLNFKILNENVRLRDSSIGCGICSVDIIRF